MEEAVTTSPDQRPSVASRTELVAASAITLAGAALLIDAAVETTWSGSPVRWWGVGAAVLYVAADTGEVMEEVVTTSPEQRPSVASPTGSGLVAASAINLIGAALLIDAAVETAWSGSPVRWWAVGAAALYVAAAASTWRSRMGVQARSGFVGVVVLGLLAATVWRPEGLTHGIRMLGQATPTVVSGATCAALVVAAVALLRATALPLAARLVFTLLALYGLAAFGFGAWHAIGYPALFAGGSVWQSAPRWLQGSIAGGLVALPIALLVSLAGGLRRGARAWRPQQIISLGLAIVMVASGFTNAAGLNQGRITLASTAVPAAHTDGVPVTASAPPAPPDATAVAAVRDASQRLLASTPKSIFDPDQKAAELGADVNGLFAFVRDNIHHEVYAGVLRGARGTLMSRAGNSWDKAVLLAALLRHHGREVRFSRGRLSPDRATALVTKMFDQARQPAAAPSLALPESVAAQSRDLIARIEARWRTAQADVTGALDRSGVSLGQNPPVSEAVLGEEAADHAWVEYRDGDRWVPLDPSAASQPGEAITAASETFAEIPDTLQHRVTFRVKVEERWNQALTEREAFVWPTTAAALHGLPLLFTHRTGATSFGRWRATPVLLVDQQAYSALSFTDAGLETQGKAANAIVGEASREVQGVGKVNELFGAPAQPAPPAATNSELTAVRLEVEFTDPSGRSETVRRDILDRIGPVARSQGAAGSAPLAPPASTSSAPIPLLGLYACAITAGTLDPRAQLERLSSSLTAIDDALMPQKPAQGNGSASPAQDQARLRQTVDAFPLLLESTAQAIHLLSQRFARRLEASGSNLVFYEATPRLAIVSVDPGASTPAVDLRRNVLRVVARGVQGQDVVRANLARGVLDGVIEDAIAEQALAGVPNAVPISAVTILDRARSGGIRIIAAADGGAVAGWTVPDVARARLGIALQGQKQVVVAPERALSIASTSRFAWWQVDPATGETVGVIDTGLYGAQAERGVELQVGRAGARAIVKEGITGAEIAQEWKAGYAAGLKAASAGLDINALVVAGAIRMGMMAAVTLVIGVVIAFLVGTRF